MSDVWVRILVDLLLACGAFSALWVIVSLWRPHYDDVMAEHAEDLDNDAH